MNASPFNVERHSGRTTSARSASEITVLVAVASARVREGLAALIGSLPNFRVVAEVESHDQAVEAACTFRPTLALIDQDLPPCGGSWTLRTLRDRRLVAALTAISLRADAVTRANVAAAGAQAYVQTGATVAEVVAALETALEMGNTAGPTCDQRALQSPSEPSAAELIYQA